jgi:hypothetical protein
MIQSAQPVIKKGRVSRNKPLLCVNLNAHEKIQQGSIMKKPSYFNGQAHIPATFDIPSHPAYIPPAGSSIVRPYLISHTRAASPA